MKPIWRFFGLFLCFALVACGGGDGADSVGFSEDFDAPGNWHTSSDPEVEIAYADGGLSIEIRVIDRVAWSLARRKFRNGIVSVEATPVGGPDDNAYGLVVRHVDDRSFYRFEISGDGYYAVQAPQGDFGWEYLVAWTESPTIHTGRATNQLQVECQGSTMIFSVNGVELTRVEDGRYREGDVGVIAGTFYVEAGTHILFDNFRVDPVD